MNTPNLNTFLESGTWPGLHLTLKCLEPGLWVGSVVATASSPTTASRSWTVPALSDPSKSMHARGTTPEAVLGELDKLAEREQWAFWTYDQFPFTLGGKVIPASRFGREPPEGFVAVQGYDRCFKPFAIIDGPAGAALKSNLDTIREDHRKAFASLGAEFLNRWRAELKRKGAVHPSEARWAEKHGEP